jgi:prefoldin subunit 1
MSGQILVQLQQTVVLSQRALAVSRQQATTKDRERRILQLTIEGISGLESDVNLYKGVGKMQVFVIRDTEWS